MSCRYIPLITSRTRIFTCLLLSFQLVNCQLLYLSISQPVNFPMINSFTRQLVYL